MNTVKILFLVVSMMVVSVTMAHTGLSSSVPAEGAMLTQSPESIELDFSADVTLTQFKLSNRMNGDAVKVDFTPTADAASSFKVTVPELPMGHYQVDWALLGGDGHKMNGSFDFMVHPSPMSMMGKSESMPMMNSKTTSEPPSETKSTIEHETEPAAEGHTH